MKVSPLTIVWLVVVFCLNSIFDGLFKSWTYFNSELALASMLDVKLLSASPDMSEFPVWFKLVEINEISEEPSWKFKIGEFMSV